MTFDGRLAKTDLRKIESTQFRKVPRNHPLLKLLRSALRSAGKNYYDQQSGGDTGSAQRLRGVSLTIFDTGQSAEEQLFDYRSIASNYAGVALYHALPKKPADILRQAVHRQSASVTAKHLSISMRVPIIG